MLIVVENGLLLLFFLFFVVTGVSAEEGNAAFIAVDVANIREKPAADAPIVGRIQMNQKIMVQKTDSGWTSIKYFGPKEYGYSTTEAIVEGWVSSSLLGKQTISSKEMIDSVTKAPSPESRKKWADRLVMAFPAADAHWKLLLKAAKELGDTASCKRAEVHLNGKEDIYLAMSVRNNLELLGKIDSLGAFTSYIWDIPGYVSDSMTYNKMQRPGLDKHLAYVLATCNWGNYTASFAAGITDTEFFQDGDLQYVSFGACPKIPF